MEILLSDGLRPFSMLAGFIVVLLVAEICLLVLGLSSQVDLDTGHGDMSDSAGIDATAFEHAQLDPGEIALLDLSPAERKMAAQRPALWRRLLRATGIGRGPLLVSLTCLAAGVSSLGFFVQLVLGQAMLPGWVALGAVLLPGLWLGGRLAALVARAVPVHESHAISGQTYHGRRGHVVIGTAQRGEPAQVRWRDSFGTTHSLMAEPLRDGEAIAAGAEVLIVKTLDRQPRIVALDGA